MNHTLCLCCIIHVSDLMLISKSFCFPLLIHSFFSYTDIVSGQLLITVFLMYLIFHQLSCVEANACTSRSSKIIYFFLQETFACSWSLVV